MDIRARVLLSLVLLFALGASMLAGCSEVCVASVQVAGPGAVERTIEGLLGAGFQEEWNVRLKKEGERYFRSKGHLVAVPARADDKGFALMFVGNKPMSPAAISVYRRMVEQLRIAVGALNIKADTVNSCDQTLL